MMRPALGGQRPGAPRAPRLGLSIPGSPNVKPVTPGAGQPAPGSRPPLPTLNINTPAGSKVSPYPQQVRGAQPGQSASGGSESSAAHSREGSFGPFDGRASNPTSAGSQYSALSFASQFGIDVSRAHGTPDPVSAAGSMYSERSEGGFGMERDGSLQGLEAFDQLSLERGRTRDVEELDNEGWQIANMEKRIEELGSLGEGAGGAVTKSKLKGGKTVFALKVGVFPGSLGGVGSNMHRSSRQIRTPTSRNRLCESSTSTRVARPSTSVATTAPLWIRPRPASSSRWSSARAVPSTASTRR